MKVHRQRSPSIPRKWHYRQEKRSCSQFGFLVRIKVAKFLSWRLWDRTHLDYRVSSALLFPSFLSLSYFFPLFTKNPTFPKLLSAAADIGLPLHLCPCVLVPLICPGYPPPYPAHRNFQLGHCPGGTLSRPHTHTHRGRGRETERERETHCPAWTLSYLDITPLRWSAVLPLYTSRGWFSLHLKVWLKLSTICFSNWIQTWLLPCLRVAELALQTSDECPKRDCESLWCQPKYHLQQQEFGGHGKIQVIHFSLNRFGVKKEADSFPKAFVCFEERAICVMGLILSASMCARTQSKITRCQKGLPERGPLETIKPIMLKAKHRGEPAESGRRCRREGEAVRCGSRDSDRTVLQAKQHQHGSHAVSGLRSPEGYLWRVATHAFWVQIKLWCHLERFVILNFCHCSRAMRTSKRFSMLWQTANGFHTNCFSCPRKKWLVFCSWFSSRLWRSVFHWRGSFDILCLFCYFSTLSFWNWNKTHRVKWRRWGASEWAQSAVISLIVLKRVSLSTRDDSGSPTKSSRWWPTWNENRRSTEVRSACRNLPFKQFSGHLQTARMGFSSNDEFQRIFEQQWKPLQWAWQDDTVWNLWTRPY